MAKGNDSLLDNKYWMSKMKTQFSILFDMDKSGTVEKVDFDLLFDKLVERKDVKPEDDIYNRVSNMRNNMWSIIQHNTDEDGDKAVSHYEWCCFWEDFASKYNKSKYIPYWCKEYIKITFFIIDKDDDDLLDADEFTAFYKETHNLPEDAVRNAFNKLTTNGDGEQKKGIDMALFNDMMIGFITSTEKTPPGDILAEMMATGQ